MAGRADIVLANVISSSSSWQVGSVDDWPTVLMSTVISLFSPSSLALLTSPLYERIHNVDLSRFMKCVNSDVLLVCFLYQQSAMMKTDAGTCASLSISLLTTSSRLSNRFLLYTPIDLRLRLYQQSNQTSHSDQPKIYPTVLYGASAYWRAILI